MPLTEEINIITHFLDTCGEEFQSYPYRKGDKDTNDIIQRYIDINEEEKEEVLPEFEQDGKFINKRHL